MPAKATPTPAAPLRPCVSLCLVVLLTWAHLVEEAGAQRCPDECSCLGTFISCFQFKQESLQQLPTNADTLVLNGGDIHSFPPGFAGRFPQLTLLDIQSTSVEVILKDTFSGLRGLDQLAMTDCQFGSIEAGAFRNISAVSQILFSGTEIGTIRSGAFSELSNIGEFSMWSTKIERVESRAFSGFSNLDSFAFYLNNVTTIYRNAFVEIENLGKVDVYMNKFFNAMGSAVTPLQAATNDMNMYSNTFPCNCGVVRQFNAPLLKRYLVSQKCSEDGQVFRLSDLNVDDICSREPSSSPSSSTSTSTTTRRRSTTSSSDVVTVSFRTTTPYKVTQIVHITTSPKDGSESGATSATPKPTDNPRPTTTAPHGGDQSSSDPGETGSGRGQSSGQTGDSSNAGSAVVASGTLVVLVPLMTAMAAASRLVSGC